MGLGVWTEARLFEDGAERTRRHEALLEVVGNRLLPQSCYVPWASSSQRLTLAHLIDDGGQFAVGVVVYDVSQRAVVQPRIGEAALVAEPVIYTRVEGGEIGPPGQDKTVDGERWNQIWTAAARFSRASFATCR
jgi:hypothetical protein